MTTPPPVQPLSDDLRTKAIAEVTQYLVERPEYEITSNNAPGIAARTVDTAYAYVAHYYRLHLPKLEEPELTNLTPGERRYIAWNNRRFYRVEIQACRRVVFGDLRAIGVGVRTAIRIYQMIRGMKQVSLAPPKMTA